MAVTVLRQGACYPAAQPDVLLEHVTWTASLRARGRPWFPPHERRGLRSAAPCADERGLGRRGRPARGGGLGPGRLAWLTDPARTTATDRPALHAMRGPTTDKPKATPNREP